MSFWVQGDLEADYADDEPTELTRLLTEDGPVHFQASDSAWFGSLKIEMRNVTMSCAAYEDIQKDMALIRQDTGISVVPGTSDSRRNGSAVPLWALILIVAGTFNHHSLARFVVSTTTINCTVKRA